jgi:predicted transcriptional regulator
MSKLSDARKEYNRHHSNIVTVRLTDDDYEDLQEFAAATGRSLCQVLKESFQECLSEHPRKGL